MPDHDDRRYLLTGASSGLGFAAAQLLVSEGASVTICARDANRLATAQLELGPAATALAGDLADPSFAETAAGSGPFDGALISVGGPPPGSALELDDDAWRSAFESVFLGAVRIARGLSAADRLNPGGALIFVLSTSAAQPVPGLAASNGLRPGLAMLVSDLADELGPRGLRAVGLLPGRFDTARVRDLDAHRARATGRSLEDIQAGAAECIPLRRYGRPEEFAQVASFVLSPAASYLTGTCIAIDGGALRGPR